MKVCSKCEKEKKKKEFQIRKDRGTLRSECRECTSKYTKDWNKKNEDRQKEYRVKNKEKIRLYDKKRDEEDPSRRKNYYQKNKPKLLIYYSERRKNDPLYKLNRLLLCRMTAAFKRKSWKKGLGAEKLLGCDYKTAFDHMEKQFTEGMCWENHGKWHIDHIIPLASAKTEEELVKLFHYTNLQPLWKKDNLSKGAKLNWTKS